MLLLQAATGQTSGDSFDRVLGFFHIPTGDIRGVVASFGLRILLIWLIAWIAHRAVVLLAARIVAHADDGDDSRLSYHEKRAQTVSQLLRSVGRTVILVGAGLGTLGLFVNILPLLGVASIFGLAVSFGAQSLVKDYIAGFFILVENQFAVGDVIESGGKTGTVERMTLRVAMLRDIEGTVHIIPNGQMTTVSNRTRGWSRAVVDVAIDYGSDIDRALDVLRDEAALMLKDSKWTTRFDAPPEVLGVQSLGENSVTLRVLLRTHPGAQGEVGREFRRRVKIRFDREGIDIRASAARVASERPPEQQVPSIKDAAAPEGFPGGT